MNELVSGQVEADQMARQRIRAGDYSVQTAGLCPGYLQTNIVILPISYAEEFIEFCQRNPKPCPLLAVSEPGDPSLPTLGSDLDIRTDLPGYSVYRQGQFDRTVHDIKDIWEDDFVTFALGCSFTFEDALLKAGVPMRHIELGLTVPMFKTEVDVVPTQVFDGQLVVSMRPVPKRSVSTVKAICVKFPHAHGAPVHWGKPSGLGINDLSNPDWGDPVPIADDEVAAFWACGVTSQVALQTTQIPFAITHRPGSMLITRVFGDTSLELLGSG